MTNSNPVTIEQFIADTQDHSVSAYVDFLALHPVVKQRINDFFDEKNFPKPIKSIKGVKRVKRATVIDISDIYVGTDTQNRVGEQIDYGNVEDISKSISEEGWDYHTEQIVVEEGDFVDPKTGKKYNYRLVSGHHRFVAILVRNCSTIPVVIVEFEDDFQREMFARCISNRSRQTAKSKPYSFQDAHFMLEQAQKYGRVKDDIVDVEKFVKSYLKDLSERMNISTRKLAEKLCSEVGVSFSQYTWNKNTIESTLAEHFIYTDDNGNVIKDYSTQGEFDSNNEQGFACCPDHSANLDNLIVNYLHAQIDNEQQIASHGKNVTNVYCGLQKEYKGSLSLKEYQKILEIEIKNRLDKIAKSAIKYENGQGGRINIKWMATDVDNGEVMNELY